MLNNFKDLFTFSNSSNKNNGDEKLHLLQIAACALLLEIADADDKISNEEKDRITDIIKNNFHLNDAQVAELIAQSENEINNSVSVYEFTDVINKNLSQ